MDEQTCKQIGKQAGRGERLQNAGSWYDGTNTSKQKQVADVLGGIQQHTKAQKQMI